MPNQIRISLLTVLIILSVGLIASAGSFTGQVVGVIDCDTIDVLRSGKAERIRLNGIDCPEKKQAYGTKAKQFTSDLAYKKTVTVPRAILALNSAEYRFLFDLDMVPPLV